ncbi:MAG TPA: NAD(P)-dependent oxidoreductase [Candidatus Elarobacter sp.]|nr:NAD(P)-dependent oxidoreductase [Dongiaceae bacterium]HZW52493.1 NAD(P)-dependent oxidoreductase [Candidatus Elarobacter sp.]
MAQRVGLLGLGIMGSAYAGHLIDAGFETSGFDIDPDAMRRFEERGGRGAADQRALARESHVVISALPSVAAADDAFFGADGMAAGAHAGLIVVEASTLPLEAKERYRNGLAAQGVPVLDAPVSGTGSQARVKDLAIYASGERAAFDAVAGVLGTFARVVRYVGEFGVGSKLKYIANLLVTIHNAATAEAVVFAQKAGIDPAMMIEVVGEGAGASRMLAVRGPMMAAGSYEPAAMKLDVYQKDIRVIADFARQVGAPTPLFAQSSVFYKTALAQDRGKQDTAAIASVLKTMARLAPDP